MDSGPPIPGQPLKPPINSFPPLLQLPNSSSLPPPNPNLRLQDPSFSIPPAHIQFLERERIDQALSKAHRDILDTGESVTACKVSKSALLSLKSDSWASLRFNVNVKKNPFLRKLTSLEGKVHALIICFVESRKIISIHELEVQICENEGVQRFEDLELGPLLRHPLVIRYFAVPPDANEIVKITSVETISYIVELIEFMESQGKSRKSIKYITNEKLLDFIALKRGLLVKEKLGIRIPDLRMFLNIIRKTREVEDSALHDCLGTIKMTPKEQMGNAEGKMSQQPCISMHKKVLPSSSEDEDDDNDIDGKDDENDCVLSSQCKFFPPNTNISDQTMGGQSSLDSDTIMIDENKRSSAKKRKYEHASVGYSLKFPKKHRHRLIIHDPELLQDSGGGISHGIRSRLPVKAVVDKVILLKRTMHFITIWKEACRLQSATEIWDAMLNFYRMGRKRMMIGLFLVAVTSIKYGMWDSLYDSFQAIGERKHITVASTSTKPENIRGEPSSGKDTLPIKEQPSQLNPGISVDGISKKICTYFDLTHAFPVEGKSALDKWFIFLRKLQDCQIWVSKQFAVEEFGSLGHGEFYRFLEEHPFLIPNELLDTLCENVCKKSFFEVSMLPDQLVILLSQAASFLWENDSITKELLYKLLKKQFPVISFQVNDDGPFGDLSELLKKHKNADSSSPVLFSVTLLGNDYVSDSLVNNNIHFSEDTVPKPDIRLISGALGSVSSKDAIQCLLKAPMLSDLHSWSHWDLIYAPSLGPLVEWLNEVYMRELLCLVTKDGKIIRIDHLATINEFLEAFKVSAYEVAVKLLSLFSLYGGQRKVPLALLKRHAQSGIEIILNTSMDCMTVENNCNTYMHDGKALKGQYALERESFVEQPLLNFQFGNVSSLGLNEKQRISKEAPVASRFILDCLCYLPSEFRSFAADVLLSGLQSLVKDAPSAVLRECSQAHQLQMLHAIGLSLNVCDWITDYHSFNSGTANNLSASFGTSSSVVASPTDLNSKFKDDALEDLSTFVDKVVGAESVEHNEVLGEVPDTKGNKVSVEKVGGGEKNILHKCKENEDGTVIVESIRSEEFGLASILTEADNIMLKKQHTRLGRALQCLSQELYSQDSHFLLELIQNADDNQYSGKVEPTLVFILQSTGLVVLNNEQGFTAQNIRALCDVGSSTKRGSNTGYIGKKGIGFKSVFRVTDCPEIHSNGFHVKFDISEGQIGFVLPTVVSPCDIVSLRRLLPHESNQTDNCWNTCIVLPFNSKLRDGMGLHTTMSMFSDLHPSVLLFLHRLQCIQFRNMLNNTFTVMKREILKDGIVKVSHGKEIMNCFVATQTLQASVIRPDVQTTKIAVAFTLREFADV